MRKSRMSSGAAEILLSFDEIRFHMNPTDIEIEFLKDGTSMATEIYPGTIIAGDVLQVQMLIGSKRYALAGGTAQAITRHT